MKYEYKVESIFIAPGGFVTDIKYRVGNELRTAYKPTWELLGPSIFSHRISLGTAKNNSTEWIAKIGTENQAADVDLFNAVMTVVVNHHMNKPLI